MNKLIIEKTFWTLLIHWCIWLKLALWAGGGTSPTAPTLCSPLTWLYGPNNLFYCLYKEYVMPTLHFGSQDLHPLISSYVLVLAIVRTIVLVSLSVTNTNLSVINKVIRLVTTPSRVWDNSLYHRYYRLRKRDWKPLTWAIELIQIMAGHSVSPWPRQLNEALLKPVLVLWLSWGNEMKALWSKNTTSNILWRAQLSITVFSGDKVARYCFSRLVHTCSIERCTKPLLGLYLVSRGSSYQKQKLKVKVWWLCTGIATFWRLLLPLAQKPRKTPKTMPFWSRLVVGTRTPQIWTEGVYCQYRRLTEGLVHWNSLVLSF